MVLIPPRADLRGPAGPAARQPDHCPTARVIEDFFPGVLRSAGLAVRVRGEVAAGLTGADGILLDAGAAHDAARRLDDLADRAFERLVEAEGAAACFHGGKDAVPDAEGFRTPHRERIARWLRDVLEGVLDRRGLPVCSRRSDFQPPDGDVRSWPVWAVGAPALCHLWHLQAAQHLRHQLRGAGYGPARPRLTTVPRLSVVGTDVVSYHRLRSAGHLPQAVFVPRPGRRFVRIDLGDALLAGLETTLGTTPSWGSGSRDAWLAAQIREVAPVTPAQAGWLAALTATGLGAAAVAVIGAWLSGWELSTGRVRALQHRLFELWPGLADHLADHAPTQVATMWGVSVDELAALVGFSPDMPAREHGYVRQLEGSGVWKRLCSVPSIEQAGFVQSLCGKGGASRRRHTPQVPDPAELESISCLLSDPHEARLARTGRRSYCRGWVPVRSLFLELADDLFTEVLFGLLEAGLPVAAAVPHEILLEVQESQVDEAITRAERVALESSTAALGRDVLRPRTVDLGRW
jgi:hypothetical protein